MEATATAKAYVKSGKLTKEVYDTIYKLDTTTSKKYVDWVSIQVVNNGFDLETNKVKLKTALDSYEDLTTRGLLKLNIAEIKSVKDLNDILEANKNVASKREVSNQDLFVGELKGFTKGKDYDIVHNDSKSIVYAIYNHKLSCTVGKDSGWCTTAKSNSDHYKNYEKQGAEFLYLIDKQIKSSGHGARKGIPGNVDYTKQHSNDMFAIHKYPNGKIMVTDKADKDNRVTWDQLKEQYNISDELFGGYDNPNVLKPIMEVKTVQDVIHNLKFMGIIEDESEVEVL
jgi:hypothetical protein